MRKHLLALLFAVSLLTAVRVSLSAEPADIEAKPKVGKAKIFADQAHRHFEKQEFGKAADDLREAIALAPEEASHHLQLGMVYMVQEDWDGAIAEFSRAYDIRVAEADQNAERIKSLSPALRKLLADHDHVFVARLPLVMAYLQRARHRARQGKHEEALQDCDAAAELDPRSAEPLCVRATIYLRNDEPAKAIDVLNQAVVLLPRDAAPYRTRAHVLTTLGQLGRALEDLNQAVELEPENSFYYLNRADVLRMLKRDDEAAADEKKAHDLEAKARENDP